MKYMYDITKTPSLKKTTWSEHYVIENKTPILVTDSSKKRTKITIHGNNKKNYTKLHR